MFCSIQIHYILEGLAISVCREHGGPKYQFLKHVVVYKLHYYVFVSFVALFVLLKWNEGSKNGSYRIPREMSGEKFVSYSVGNSIFAWRAS